MSKAESIKYTTGESNDSSGTDYSADIETNASNIETNSNNITTNSNNITTNTSNIETNTSNISTNSTDIASNASNITTNSNNITTNTSNITTNSNNITTNTSNIELFETTFARLDGASFTGAISTKGLLYEGVISVSGTGPYTIDYSLGGIFYIPTASVQASDFSIIITNVPTDSTKSYTISCVYYQNSNTYFGSSARISDTSNTYILGSSNTYVAPLFSGGIPEITTAPSMIIQQFNIISIDSVRYCISSVGQYY
jgi:hypothetical protein